MILPLFGVNIIKDDKKKNDDENKDKDKGQMEFVGSSSTNPVRIRTKSTSCHPVTPKTPVQQFENHGAYHHRHRWPSLSSSSSSTSSPSPSPSSPSLLLLCERWISDGINVSRNGSCDYREVLNVSEPLLSSKTKTTTSTTTSSSSSSFPMLRFRSSSEKIQGTFPKQLSDVLSPLYHTGYIRLHAYALMEQRDLVTGSHVAFGLS